MEEIKNLNLPEWVWLNGGEHEDKGDPLKGRSLIMHTRSASVMEILERDLCVIKEDFRQIPFEYTGIVGGIEEMVCVLHYSATLDDWGTEIEDIMRKSIEWYKRYCSWEDKNILMDNHAELN